MTQLVAIGAGRMGRGIAQVCASAGYEVALIDFKLRDRQASKEFLQAARSEISEDLDFLAELGLIGDGGRDTILARIEFADFKNGQELFTDAEYVFEAVPETIAAKKDALNRLTDLAPASAIIASTTSTIQVDKLAEFVKYPELFLNGHWLNPAYLIPLVEVSPGAATSDATFAAFMHLLKILGKAPVKCKASPGFIIPRIQAVAMNEAARMIEEGVATAEDIDTAIRTGFGIRYAAMGLVEFIDWGGVDILYFASNYLREAFGSERYETPKIVKDLMHKGKLGVKTGSGFYDFTNANVDDFRQDKLKTITLLLQHLDLLPKIVGD